MTALITTWNVGASNPHHLRHSDERDRFLRELFPSQEPPDVMVFGFQELIDLEDKKVTASECRVFPPGGGGSMIIANDV